MKQSDNKLPKLSLYELNKLYTELDKQSNQLNKLSKKLGMYKYYKYTSLTFAWVVSPVSLIGFFLTNSDIFLVLLIVSVVFSILPLFLWGSKATKIREQIKEV